MRRIFVTKVHFLPEFPLLSTPSMLLMVSLLCGRSPCLGLSVTKELRVRGTPPPTHTHLECPYIVLSGDVPGLQHISINPMGFYVLNLIQKFLFISYFHKMCKIVNCIYWGMQSFIYWKYHTYIIISLLSLCPKLVNFNFVSPFWTSFYPNVVTVNYFANIILYWAM